MNKLLRHIMPAIFLFSTLVSCSEHWLEEKSDKSLVVPQTLDDFQALLDNSEVMNVCPAMGELSCDDYYLEDKTWETLSSQAQKNYYVWEKEDYYAGENNGEWLIQYRSILYANVVLEGVSNASGENEPERRNTLRGSALFYRALGHYNLAEIYGTPFNVASSVQDLSIPLRLASDVTQPTVRQTVKEVYDQIVKDLKEAVSLLPEKVSIQTRPSKAAAYGLLSRVYLIMGEYENALENADNCLAIDSELIDYTKISLTESSTFQRYNKEVIFDTFLTNMLTMILKYNFADSLLLKSYDIGDLRKEAFFVKGTNNNYTFKGSYGGAARTTYTLWGGISKNEIYLIQAECLIRTGEINQGLSVLRQLLQYRYANNIVEIPQFSSGEDALRYVFAERRKELPYRGIRFVDLRRLNQDPKYAISLKRKIGAMEFTLLPNDPRYLIPIPDQVIALSGISQNTR